MKKGSKALAWSEPDLSDGSCGGCSDASSLNLSDASDIEPVRTCITAVHTAKLSGVTQTQMQNLKQYAQGQRLIS